MSDEPESQARSVLREHLLLRMLGFGFFSGLPLPLSVFTLQQWFTTSGVSVHSVGLTAWLGLPYTVKFSLVAAVRSGAATVARGLGAAAVLAAGSAAAAGRCVRSAGAD
ncbi:MAG: hypothetical protein WDN04_15385 [Rhodospirillales bacterium]